MIPEKLISLLKSTHFESPVLRALQERVCRDKTVFAKPSLAAHKNTLPIAEFKNPNWNPDGIRTFRSSGTTAAERSRSTFSAEGLLAYELFSRLTFAEIFSDFSFVLSFVPPTSEWADSSLAQMVEWIGKDFEMVDEPPREKTVVIGTSFHFVNLYDAGKRFKLAPGSIVIDTGGTKGKSRALSRDDMNQLLCELFSVTPDQLSEEYGMCELASQAYRKPGCETFEFPFWVRAEIQDRPFATKESGKGILVLSDHLRIDIKEKIQTEDLAEMNTNGFKILGRVPRAVQKGCSLTAEITQPATVVVEKTHAELSDQSLTKVAALIEKLFAGSEAEKLLTEEFSSAVIAKQCVSDLLKSLPKSKDEWKKAAEIVARDLQPKQHWLILAPSNHSIATLYHFAFLKALDCTVQIRIPKTMEKSFLKLFSENFANQILSADVKLDSSTPKFFDALLAFGSNETILQLNTLKIARFQSYGASLAGSVMLASDWKSQNDLLARDLLSLRQRGCKSSRFCLIVNDSEVQTSDLQNSIAKNFPDLWNNNLIFRRVLDFEKAKSTAPFENPIEIHIAENLEALKHLLTQANEGSAVFLTVSKFEISQIISQIPTLNHLSISPGAGKIFNSFSNPPKNEQLHSPYYELADLGSIQTIVWNGFYEGRRLFQPR